MNYKKLYPRPFDVFNKTRIDSKIPFIVSLLCPLIKDIVNVSTELNDPKSNSKFSDIIIETKDKIFIIEFQTSGRRIKDLHRFINYYGNILNSKKYDFKLKKQVYAIIIYTEKVEKNFMYKNGFGLFKFITFSLKDYDGDEYLNKIKSKIENNIELSKKEKQILQYIPLFHSKKSPKELLKETIKLVDKDNYLTDDEKTDIREGQMLLALGFSETNEEFEEWLNMILESESILETFKKDCRERGRQEGKLEGRQEGRQEGRREGRREGLEMGVISVVKAMIDNNYPIDEISHISGLSVDKIESIY